MNINIKSTNLDLTPALKNYIEKRISYLNKFVKKLPPDAVICDVQVEKVIGNQKKGDIFRAEINLEVEGKLYRAEETSEDIFTSIDQVKEQVSRNLKNAKDREITLIRRGARSIRKALGISKLARFRKSSKFEEE